MIRIIVRNQAGPELRNVVERMGQTETVNRQISVQFYGWVIRNFEAAGGMQTPPWKALSPRTIREKKRLGYSSQPLLRTGNLRNSFLSFADKEVAGVGARASFFFRGDGKKPFDYAVAHQQGTASIPARPMLPPEHYVREIALKAYENFVARAVGA